MTAARGGIRGRVFYLVSRVFTWVYRHFPIFGRLRGAIAIIRRTDQVLVIERNDGRGWCFPGGFARWGESPEAAVKREVREETGMTVTSCRFVLEYEKRSVRTYVFEVQASGDLRASWEGAPRWVSLSELERNIFPNQQPALALLQRLPAP